MQDITLITFLCFGVSTVGKNFVLNNFTNIYYSIRKGENYNTTRTQLLAFICNLKMYDLN